jgi:polysaccharide export outer membrane protein
MNHGMSKKPICAMGINLTRYVHPSVWGFALIGALLLQGCAPGFSSVSAYEADQSLPPEFQYLPADGAPDGVITSISPALIRAMAEAQPTAVPSEVKALFGEAPVYTIGPGDVVGVIVYDHPELLPNAGAVITQQADPTGISVAPFPTSAASSSRG